MAQILEALTLPCDPGAARVQARTQSPCLYLGVEDNGTPTGLHKKHLDITGLGALGANRTVPPLIAQVEPIESNGIPVARITVPKARQIVATSDGVLKRRRLQAHRHGRAYRARR